MARQIRPYMFVLWLVALSITGSAQQVTSAKTTPPKAKAAKAPEAGAGGNTDLILKQRKETVVGLLASLAEEARSYTNLASSARVQARVANTLWDVDRDQAHALFRRAWDAAVTADSEALRKSKNSPRGQIFSLPNLREEVLKLASRRDRVVGEELLAKYTELKDKEATEEAAKIVDPGGFMSPTSRSASAQRLTLARQLLKSGDTERALQFADSALNQVSMQAMTFLSALRQNDADAADKRYASLLVLAAADPTSDANTVSLLSSYAFTPFLYVTVTPQRGPMTAQVESAVPTSVFPPQLRAAFFDTASLILLRPLPPEGQDQTTAGRAGLYFIIARLLPLYEQYAPAKASSLRNQLATLTPDAPENYRNGKDTALNQGLVPEADSPDELQAALEQLDNTADPATRDKLNANAAIAAAQKGDARASEFAGRIKDEELRKRILAFVEFTAVKQAIDKKDAPEVVRLARAGNLTHLQRAWALTAAAPLFLKNDRARVFELLDEATAEARRISESEPERVSALIAIATRFFEVDHNRAWETMLEAVKLANSTKGYTGENGRVSTRLQTADGIYMTNFPVTAFDLTGIFGALAKDDMLRAITLAKTFQDETPRAVATLAIARTVLNTKP